MAEARTEVRRSCEALSGGLQGSTGSLRVGGGRIRRAGATAEEGAASLRTRSGAEAAGEVHSAGRAGAAGAYSTQHQAPRQRHAHHSRLAGRRRPQLAPRCRHSQSATARLPRGRRSSQRGGKLQRSAGTPWRRLRVGSGERRGAQTLGTAAGTREPLEPSSRCFIGCGPCIACRAAAGHSRAGILPRSRFEPAAHR